MNNRGRDRIGGDDTPVIASGRMPDFLRNKCLPDLPLDLDRTTADLTVLLSTNRDRLLAFREVDLASMDAHTKKILLKDVNRMLGITPLSMDDC